MMKKIIIFLSSLMLFIQPIVAQSNAANCDPKVKKEEEIVRLCNNIDDIICKEVKVENRRSCDGKEEYIFSSNTTTTDLYNFFKKCLGSSVQSFTQFFTDFIPELLKAIWNVSVETAKLAKNSVTGKGEGLGAKLFGFYETIASVTADIYEAAKEDPVAMIKNLWNQISEVTGQLVANFDCLKPEIKVEKICGFVSGWIVPPLMLAKILVKGVAYAPTIMKSFNVSEELIAKMRSALKFSENRPKKSLSEYRKMFDEYKRLGYTQDEIEFLYKTGKMDKVKLEDLGPVSTKIGSKQKAIILEGFTKPNLPSSTPTTGSKPTQNLLKPVTLNLKTDYVSFNVVINGKLTPVNGHIFETSIVDTGISKYKIQYIDPTTNKMRIADMTPDQLKKANVSDSSSAMTQITERAQTDKSVIDPMEEFKKLEAEVQNKPKYEGAIEYEKVPGADGLQIVKSAISPKSGPKLKIPKDNELVIPGMRTNYIRLLDQNSMGYVTYMPAQLIGVVKERNIDKYLIRVFDTTTNSFIQKSYTKRQLELMKSQADGASEKIIKEKSQNKQLID